MRDLARSVAYRGLYHLAWEVDTLAELRRISGVLAERGALVGAADHGSTKALYARDPDGIERYGEQTPGGIGVSVPSR